MTARLFTVGDFRFSVQTAIGKYSRLATFGEKEKDGARMEFNAATLGSMVDNFKARGDKLAICQDHLSAYVGQTGRPAPALGYFTALAVVEGGKVLKFATVAGDAPPDAAKLDDGLWACLGEVTPLGADPLQGFAGFAFLSPMFSESATDEAGRDIGYALFDAAVTNTPHQPGCAIQFHSAPTVAMGAIKEWEGMVLVQTGPADSDTVAALLRRAGIQWRDSSMGKEIRDVPIATVRAALAPVAQYWSAPTAQAVTMAEVGNQVRCPNCQQTVPVAPGWKVADHTRYNGGANDHCNGSGRDASQLPKMSAPTNGATAMANSKTEKPDAVVKCPECRKWVGEFGGKLEQHTRDGTPTDAYREGNCHGSGERAPAGAERMSATTPGARRLSNGAPMPPEMLKKFGLADDASDADKMAALMKYAAECEEKLAKFAVPDEDEDKAKKEMASDLGVDEGPKAMSRCLAALRATRVPQSDVVKLQQTVHTLSQKLDARDKVDADAKFAAFADSAIANGQWDPAKRDNLITFARADMKAAEGSLQPKGSYTLMTRLAAGLPDARRPAVTSPDGKRGVAFAAAVKAHMAANKGTAYEVAAVAVAKAQPDLAADYLNA